MYQSISDSQYYGYLMTKILVEVFGGLGNQLFQLSAARYLQTFNLNVSIDCSPNRINKARQNEIGELAQVVNLLEPRRRLIFPDIAKLRYRVSAKFPFFSCIQSEPYNFSIPSPIFSRISIRYRGYWQNIKCAETLRPVVREYVSPLAANSVGVHIRKGDYLNPKHIGLHGELPDSYFVNAVEEIAKITDSRTIVLYSDSPNLIMNLFSELTSLGWSVRVEKNTDPWETLQLLSGHRFLVASNSTYSWWAGFAGICEVCYFPSEWFIDLPFPDELLFDKARKIPTTLANPSLIE